MRRSAGSIQSRRTLGVFLEPVIASHPMCATGVQCAARCIALCTTSTSHLNVFALPSTKLPKLVHGPSLKAFNMFFSCRLHLFDKHLIPALVQDLFCFGPPCCPYSVLNNKKHQEYEYNPFEEAGAQPFIHGCRHVRDSSDLRLRLKGPGSTASKLSQMVVHCSQ